MTMVGVDVGGTFTDVVAWDGSKLVTVKTSTTRDQAVGVAEGARLAAGRADLLLHGTTVATNALLERKGSPLLLITDPGFEDVVEIGRQDRPSLYDPFADRPAPLVDRNHRIGYRDTDPLPSPEPGRVAVVARLFAYAEPDRDLEVVRRLESGGWDPTMIVPAVRVAPEYREFERTSTAVLTGYLRPVVTRYLVRLGELLPAITRRMLVMRSSGGLVPPDEAATEAASILLSGPAGGVVAAAELGRALGHRRVVSFDMGGTSTDVCRIEDGRPEVGYQRTVDGYVCRVPSVAVHTVGAGGGSVGWMDQGGALRVGPRSAGADPGPACYGRGGTEPTVTDANLVLGRLDPEGRLADSLTLSWSAALEAVRSLGDALGLDPIRTAEGMVEVVESNMERAVRRVSVEEGVDPRKAVLVAFGGAGGLHATALARRLEMAGVAVPPHAGVFSALGLLLSPPRRDRARSVMLAEGDARLDHLLDSLADETRRDFEETIGEKPQVVDTMIDVRYLGQSHETTVSYRVGEGWSVLVERFHSTHHRRNGFSRPGDPVEATTLRAVAVGVPVLHWDDLPEHRPRGEARRPDRRVIVDRQELTAEVWWRPGMAPGGEVTGPAVIEDVDTTVFLRAGDRARLHPTGALEVEW
ncbi:MAG: 5-oxoprolinase [Acidimicrobiia bacterium]|nr:MAG: 5-oxoprolinase [Acidimicrobiia bacterium]